MKNSFVEGQHYVPKMLLRNFCFQKDKIWVLDKFSMNVFHTNIKNVASENNFNDIDTSNGRFSLENSLSVLEEKASRLVKIIVETESLGGLSYDDKSSLAEFFAVQRVRTPRIRKYFKSLYHAKKEFYNKMGTDISRVKGWKDINESDIKKAHLDFVTKVGNLVPFFLGRKWILFKFNEDELLYLSDNPVVLTSAPGFLGDSSSGLALKNVEIYVPISSGLVIGMCFSDKVDEFESMWNEYGMLSGRTLSEWLDEVCNSTAVKNMARSIIEGCAYQSDINRIQCLNYLQVAQSVRFIFSPSSDFSFAKKMISDNPNMRKGVSVTVS